MKRILSFVAFFMFCAFINVNAADWAVSISAASFDDEEETTFWIEGTGFDYAWGGVAKEANVYSNERNTIKVHIDGYTECLGNVNITLGRMGLHAGGWTWIEPSTKYYNDEDGLKAALTKDDFDENGRLILELELPAGMKPATEYEENTADTPTLWLFQVTGTNSAEDHECGKSFCNFVVDVSEEIVASTGGGGETEEAEEVEANQWALSIGATSFDDEEAVWVEGVGFDYGWGGVASEANMYSNERNVVTAYIDGYTTCLGNINVTLGRMGLHAGGWAFIDPIHYKSDEEEDALAPALTPADFDNGRAVIEITLPEGMKPAADYEENTADTPTLWLLQFVGANNSPDHACGESYVNFIIDVTEEIGEGTGVSLNQISSLLVYPNPVKAGNNIVLNASEFVNDVKVRVYNLGGQVVAEQLVNPSEVAIVNANFAPGMYTVEMNDGVSRGIQKLIVR